MVGEEREEGGKKGEKKRGRREGEKREEREGGEGKEGGGCKGGEQQDGKISDGDTVNAAGDCSRPREVVPRRRVAGMTACRNALVVAVRDGADVEHIIEQAKAYYLTPHAKGQFGWGLLAFIRDGHCDDDPAAWQDRDQETPARSASFNRTPEEDAIYVARRLREMAEDR